MQNTIKTKVFAIIGLSVLGSVLFLRSDFVYAHSLSVITTGVQIIDVSSNGTGTSISVDNVTVATTCHAGYNLTLSTSVNDNNLYLNGSANNNTAGTFFSPSDGITGLASADNTWGYYLPASGASAPTSSSVFNEVPALGSTSAILKTSSETASDTDINDSFSVYYGVSVSDDFKSGTYKMIQDDNSQDGSLVYYATLSEDCFKYTVHFNPTGTNMGVEVTGTGTVDNQSIMAGVATNLTTSKYGNPTVGGTTYYFTGWNTAQDGSGVQYSVGQSVTDLTTPGSIITLYAQWTDCQSNKICYKKNGDDVVGTMSVQSITASVTSATLRPSNYSRVGFGFVGWSTSPDGSTGIYGPVEQISFPARAYVNGGMTLYAIWVESAGYLQGWSGCENLTPAVYSGTPGDQFSWSISADLNSVTALTDSRDNQTYAVARLSDNRCWMIENLRLGSTAVLAIADTNNPLNDGANVTLKHNYNETNTYSTLSPSSSVIYDEDTAPYGWCLGIGSPIGCTNQSSLNTSNTTNRLSGDITNNLYSYGNYYNLYSATAGNKYDAISSVIVGDLCPSGWHLPTGTGSGEFGILSNSLGGYQENGVAQNMSDSTTPRYAVMASRLSHFPNNLVFSGSVTGYNNDQIVISYRGSGAEFYTSSVVGSSQFQTIRMSNSMRELYPGTTSLSTDSLGRTIRCIADSN